MKKHFSTIVLAALLLVGLSLLLYPSVADWWNSKHQTRAVATYTEAVEDLDEKERERLWSEARAYNKRLAEQGTRWVLSDEEGKDYNAQLSVVGTEVMSYVDIPAIECNLPIYHGTDNAVLQVAIGHIEGSSLPVGGPSTHCVVSGHRGLPSAELFTNLDQLVVGDVFMLHTLGRTLTYKVDKILIVDPDELDSLLIQDGKDLCTLVTCTPYGVNSHRLLVQGYRVDNIVEADVTADALRIDPMVVAICLAAPLLLVFFVGSMLTPKKDKAGRAKRVKVQAEEGE